MSSAPLASRRPHHRQQRKRAWAPAGTLIGALATIAFAAWIGAAHDHQSRVDNASIGAGGNTSAVGALPAVSKSAEHPVYRYSVVPGGVRSPEDVATAVATDPVVADHYRAVATDRLRLERVATGRLVYMSYRVGNNVYWTKQPIRIAAGETILTDGAAEIRTRCGNCLSTAPMLPTLENEPETVEFDALLDAPGPQPKHEPAPSVADLTGAHNSPSALAAGGTRVAGVGSVAPGSLRGGSDPAQPAVGSDDPDSRSDLPVIGPGGPAISNADPGGGDPGLAGTPLEDPFTPEFEPPHFDGGDGRTPPDDPDDTDPPDPDVQTAPEPGLVLLLGVGLAAAARRLRSRHQRSSDDR